MRIFFASVFFSFISISSLNAQETDRVDNTMGVDNPPTSSLPVIALDCSFSEGTQRFSFGFAGGGKIFSVDFRKCTVENKTNGLLSTPSYSLVIPVVVGLNRKADVSKCNSFALAVLLQVLENNPDFVWGGFSRVINAIQLGNLGGTKANTENFVLHDKSGQANLTVANSFLVNNDRPNYDDLFFGRVSIDGIENTGETNSFGRELAKVTPIIGAGTGKIDYKLDLEVILFPPRAVCYERLAPSDQAEGTPGAIIHELEIVRE